jgi:hypothetical protein
MRFTHVLKHWSCLAKKKKKEKRKKKKTVISWYKIVWFPMAIPRHSFILWLVFKDALVTKLKMCGWGYGSDTLRRFCYGKQENVEHLFMHCSFSRRVWRSLMANCLIFNPIIKWEEVVRWSIS